MRSGPPIGKKAPQGGGFFLPWLTPAARRPQHASEHVGRQQVCLGDGPAAVAAAIFGDNPVFCQFRTSSFGPTPLLTYTSVVSFRERLGSGNPCLLETANPS